MLARTIDRCIIVDVPYANIDCQNVHSFKQNLLTAYLSSSFKDMIINMQNVSFIDAAGLEALLFAGSLVQEADGKLSLFALNPFVRQILMQTRLYKYFDINRTLTESLEFIKDNELTEICNYQLLRKKVRSISA